MVDPSIDKFTKKIEEQAELCLGCQKEIMCCAANKVLLGLAKCFEK